MSKSRFTVRQLTTGGIIGAAYVALTLLAAAASLAYGPIQFRFSEALCVLPFLFPEATWGLFAGCLIMNLLSPYGLLDIVLGSLATLLAAVLTQHSRSRILAPLPPVLCNGILVGGLIAFEQVGFTSAFWAAFAYNGFTVAVGEAAVCYALGFPLLHLLPGVRPLQKYMAAGRVHP